MTLNQLPLDVLDKIAHLLKSEKNPSGADPDALLPVPTGFHVLCLQYIRSEMKGSIILAASTLREDAYQGRIGVVLALGVDAYTDRAKYPTSPWCKVGDFVAWPALENAAARYPFDGATLACITDDRVVLKDCDPERMVGR